MADETGSKLASFIFMAALFLSGLIVGLQIGEGKVSRLELSWAKERERHAGELAEANAAALSRERELARQFSDAAGRFELEKENAIRKSSKVAADLRGGALRLRREWAGCETARLSAASARAAAADGGADDRAASAGRIVRAAAECDAQVKGLQDILRTERQ